MYKKKTTSYTKKGYTKKRRMSVRNAMKPMYIQILTKVKKKNKKKKIYVPIIVSIINLVFNLFSNRQATRVLFSSSTQL